MHVGINVQVTYTVNAVFVLNNTVPLYADKF